MLEGGQPGRAEGPQVVETGGGAPGATTTTAHTTSPQAGSGSPTTATSRHPGWPAQHGLDLGRGHRLAAGADDVAGAADDGEVAVVVDVGQVAGAVPAVDAAPRRGRRVAEVAVEEQRAA